MTEEQEDLGTATQDDGGTRSNETGVRLRENPREFTVWQRVQIFIASWLGYLAILLIGRTMRWRVFGWENWTSARKLGRGLIYTFWHREIFSACWFWRKRGIVVMTSQNFDGEYIARIIQKHGYGAARGSSTRGAPKALAEMAKCLKDGLDTAFTIDGPRGPRFVAKRGSVLLSKATGAAILCFHVAPEKAHVFKKSWDMNQIPYPFTRAAVFIAPPIVVPPQADIREQAEKIKEVQTVLDDLRARGENWAKQQALKREIRIISPP
jgi:lysophospholipid acyltransferase (LPLAT)-like uncharacterized protein